MKVLTLRRPRLNGVFVLITLLFITACALGILVQKSVQPDTEAPRARFHDRTPLGGKGLNLLLLRLGYNVRRIDSKLSAMPRDASVWVLLDPQVRFTQRETQYLLQWVRSGGTLIWACAPDTQTAPWLDEQPLQGTASTQLCEALGITPSYSFEAVSAPLPVLTPLTPSAASLYWQGVQKAQGSGGTIKINRSKLELAGSQTGSELARLDVGQGRIFVTPDALLFTNYALSKPDNAVLVTNLVRVHAPGGTVYFDERNHTDAATLNTAQRTPTIVDYLWRPPLRWAMLQLLGALLLWWALVGRRLGAPVPIREHEPVTRASQFALGMGALFRKANRPRAVAKTLGNDFRREVTRRVGLSVEDNDLLIAERVSQATQLPQQMIDRLLLRGKVPGESEAEILSDTQEMELVLRTLRGERKL
jgi:hypothetical protein